MLIGAQNKTGGKLSCHTQDKIDGNTHGTTGEYSRGMTGDKTIRRVLNCCSLLFAEDFFKQAY
jgi:hypothetical protein